MQRVLFVKMSPEMKEKFHNNLSNKIKSTVAEVTMQDKMNLQNSLKSFKITENDQTLYFINKFIAKLLQRSAHSILKDLGEKCVNFFTSKEPDAAEE